MTMATPTTPQPAVTDSGRDSIDWATIEADVRAALVRYADRFGLQVAERPLLPSDHFRVALEGLPFPDGVGEGTVIAWGAHVLGDGRVGIRLEHDRCFRNGWGDVGRHLYLNDYLFIDTFAAGQRPSADRLQGALVALDSARKGLERARQRALAINSCFYASRLRAALPTRPTAGEERDGSVAATVEEAT